MGNENFRPLFIVASLFTFFVNLQEFSIAMSDPNGSGVGVGIMLDSGDVSLINDSESHVSDAKSFSLSNSSFSLSRLDSGVRVLAGDVCFEMVRFRISPVAVVVVSLFII